MHPVPESEAELCTLQTLFLITHNNAMTHLDLSSSIDAEPFPHGTISSQFIVRYSVHLIVPTSQTSRIVDSRLLHPYLKRDNKDSECGQSSSFRSVFATLRSPSTCLVSFNVPRLTASVFIRLYSTRDCALLILIVDGTGMAPLVRRVIEASRITKLDNPCERRRRHHRMSPDGVRIRLSSPSFLLRFLYVFFISDSTRPRRGEPPPAAPSPPLPPHPTSHPPTSPSPLTFPRPRK